MKEHPQLRVVEGTAGMDNKQKALEAALAQIEKSFGKGSIMKLGAKETTMDIEAISTGSLGLDIALGIGGLPKGRIIEIYGPESSGKTTLALHVIAEAQKLGGTCAFVDAEHALDPVYARKLGVQVQDLLISQPDTGEQALEITDTLVRSGAVDVLVIDSVAALTPKAELEGEMGDSLPGLQARLMSQALRKLTGSISKSKTMVIFINQIRMKIGVMFGNPETTTGGNALKFYASVRLDIRRIGQIKDKDEAIGNQARVKVVKNKVAPPLSSRLNSISCTASASPSSANWSILGSRPISSKNPVRGCRTRASASARAAKTPRRSSRRTPRSPMRSSVPFGPTPVSLRCCWQLPRATKPRKPRKALMRTAFCPMAHPLRPFERRADQAGPRGTLIVAPPICRRRYNWSADIESCSALIV
jgi:recombination protein RecA